MQLNFPLLPHNHGKKTERITIACTKEDVERLISIIKEYAIRKGITLSPAEFAYIAFIKGMQAAIGVLSLPDDAKKIF